MLEDGLLDEIRALLALGVSPKATAMQAIGYKEFVDALDGRCTIEEAADLVRQSSRRYAKRQLTWFRRDERIKFLYIDDYDTPDGTGVRDYIHVVDLANGHVKALKKIEENAGLCIYNLGTGHGYSVLDIVKNFEEANGIKIPYSIKPRRPGDIATCYCDPSKAERELGWKAQYGIKEMCEDSWRWQKNNPNGYEE